LEWCGVLEIAEPSPQRRIEIRDDPREAVASAAARVSERMCKQVSVSLPYRGDSHDKRHDDYT
jgi:hypothetical protein